MAVLKCKMCGGELAVADNSNICVCDYCGTKQTVPSARDEILSNLFNSANNLRLRSEFDKAQELYEKIVAENPNEAEAYWGIVLCKYGIEYVEDPATKTRIPTCHRTQLQSILADGDYKSAITNADVEQKAIYEEEAGRIDEIQKDILKIVHNEKPFDVFICYKETDDSGKRTVDSSIANDIYHQLTQEGFKVFYAAITLEDKLGQEYEPYIFAALNSAKTMLVLGTKPEYFTAVWVRNEWSRFMKLMQNDRSKLLIPCYRDMDAYDLPEEFAHLQAQDMGKIGFINDVVRGIKKITPTENVTKTADTVKKSEDNIEPLLKRAFIFLEDRDWKSADEYCEKVLDHDPENPSAYLGKMMAELKVKNLEELKKSKKIKQNSNYNKVIRFDKNNEYSFLKGLIHENRDYAKLKEELIAEYKQMQKKIAVKTLVSVAVLGIGGFILVDSTSNGTLNENVSLGGMVLLLICYFAVLIHTTATNTSFKVLLKIMLMDSELGVSQFDEKTIKIIDALVKDDFYRGVSLTVGKVCEICNKNNIPYNMSEVRRITASIIKESRGYLRKRRIKQCQK